MIQPWANGLDVTNFPQNMWIIDFGVDMPENIAAQYERPFEYMRKHVKPARDIVRNALEKNQWWLHARPAHEMREKVSLLKKYIATSNVAKHRLFIWIESKVLPSHSLTIFAREDDYFIGVLQSKLHVLWSLKQGTSLEDRPRYTPSTSFETFPFPWAPGAEPVDDPRVKSIAAAAKELVEQRDRWLNAEGFSEAEKKKRTLTNLYNARPIWLDLAHKRLDAAVFAAYGWKSDLSDEEILEKLLALNLERGKSLPPNRRTDLGKGNVLYL